MKQTSFRSVDLLVVPLLVLALGWYLLVAEKIAVILYTGFSRDELWKFCVEKLPDGLPPIYEGPLPGAESQIIPIRYSCTYTQNIPNVSEIYTDFFGTTIAFLPLVVIVVYVAIRFVTILKGRDIEKNTPIDIIHKRSGGRSADGPVSNSN